jgi:hypothetical protein
LVNNAQYQLDSSSTGYFSQVKSNQADNDDVAFSTRLTVKSQTKLSDAVHAGFELYGTYSSQKQEYHGVFRNPGNKSRQAKLLDFNSVWLRYKGDDFDFTLGKDEIKNGSSEIYSPTDRFGQYNLANPIQIYRLGVWQASLNYFINDDTLSLKVLPIAEKNLIPSVYSRWLGDTNDPEFTALLTQLQIEEKYRPVRFENTGYLLQYKGSRVGYDFFGLLHHGPSVYPTLHYGRQFKQLIKTEPLATSISAGVIKVIEEWKIYSDAIYQRSDNHQDDDFIRYCVGVVYNDSQLANAIGFNQITTTLQWAGDETIAKADAALVAISSHRARPFRNTMMTIIEIEHNNRWGYYFHNTYNLGGDYAVLVGMQYKPNDNLSLRLDGGTFQGDSNTLFGRWQNNEFLRFRTEYKF